MILFIIILHIFYQQMFEPNFPLEILPRIWINFIRLITVLLGCMLLIKNSDVGVFSSSRHLKMFPESGLLFMWGSSPMVRRNIKQRYTVKKRFTTFPSPAGMSLTKVPHGQDISVMTSLFPPRESLVVTSRLGTGNSRTFFYGVASVLRLYCKA